MNTYVIFFNQQWVGDHPAEWYVTRGPLARAVVEEMRQAGALVHAGGLDEDLGKAFSADGAEARMWAGKLAAACGWPQEVRPIT